MHKGTMPRAVAVDALCIIAGFLAAIAATALLPSSLDPAAATRSWLQAIKANLGSSSALVNRARKGDRLDVLPFSERLAGAPGSGASSLPHRDPSGRVLFWIDPATNTTIVPKGVPFGAGERGAAEPAPAAKPPAPKELPAPSKIGGCEPVASPLADPIVLRFLGRCMAQLESSLFD
jgi:hypothetical protein